MAGNIGEYENPQNPIDSGEVNNQTNPIDPQNDDTQHGWTDPTGGNMDPHYQGDTEPVDGGEVTVVTHFGEEVIGKIDRLIEIVRQGARWWRKNGYIYFRDKYGRIHRVYIEPGAEVYVVMQDGKCVVTQFFEYGAHGWVSHGWWDSNGTWHGGRPQVDY